MYPTPIKPGHNTKPILKVAIKFNNKSQNFLLAWKEGQNLYFPTGEYFIYLKPFKRYFTCPYALFSKNNRTVVHIDKGLDGVFCISLSFNLLGHWSLFFFILFVHNFSFLNI